MIEWLETLDHSIILAINGANSPWLDEFMWIVSGKWTWTPFALILLFIVYRKRGLSSVFVCIGAMAICVLIADLASVHLFKEVFQRYRPSHNTDLCHILHLYQYDNGEFYKGGMYGFVSSHAANFFALGTFLYFFTRSYIKYIGIILLSICFLIGYSRVYLGVHYPSDVLLGGILGAIFGVLVFQLSKLIKTNTRKEV